MVKSIDIILNSSIVISFKPKIVAIKDHAVLEHLDYEHSGHTGFASSEQLNEVNNSAVHKTGDERVSGTKTFVGPINFDALIFTSNGEFRFADHVYFTDNSNEHKRVLEIYANDIIAQKTFTAKGAVNVDGLIYAGGNELRFKDHLNITDNTDAHNVILHIFRDYINAERIVTLKRGANIDVQPTEAQHATRKDYVDNLVNNAIAALKRDGKLKAELIPDEFDEVIEFEKQVSGATFLSQAYTTPVGTVVWCAATKTYAGDAYYRKFLVNTNGTAEGITTFDPVEGKLYVGKTDSNIFRWSGSNLLEVSKAMVLGETSTTAYAGNKGKANADAIAQLQTDVAGKQNTLVSGTNIKTVNGVSILGSGDATIPGTPLTKITKTTLTFTAEEKTALINMQACLYYQSKLFIPTAYDSSNETLTLLSHHAINGLTSITINLNSDTVSVAGKTLNSIIYKHVITFPSSRWFKANNTSIYMTQIVLYTNKVVSIDDNWDLFDLLETDFFVSGKIYYSNGSTTYSETLAYSISGTSYSAKKLICHEGSYFVLTQNPVSVSDDVRTIM
ncbi:MAG: hypothetical protein J6I84_08335 [Bacilli bacterium]|nr:hypothetical protein [Bacilli bacterium]